MSAQLAFSDASKAKIQELLGRYRDRRAALIPALWVAQREFGWVSTEAMQLVAKELDIPEAWVYSTATFYTMFHKRPIGRQHIQICTNIACYLRGSDELMAVVKEELGIGHGQTTADKEFTCEGVQCLAACGHAPAVQMNEDDYFSVTPEQMRELIRGYKGKPSYTAKAHESGLSATSEAAAPPPMPAAPPAIPTTPPAMPTTPPAMPTTPPELPGGADA